MDAQALTLELSNVMALPERELISKALHALIQKEIRMAEVGIAEIRERYDMFSKEALLQAIQDGKVAGHPAWEDYIVWKNKEAFINHLRGLVESG